mmetsp:Transcript_51090/g.129878  ORF Transcript_51090/g.129878 Transcript_51090/m.129878 type:complete len:249 (+) Transcript_51090:686-1432(+)
MHLDQPIHDDAPHLLGEVRLQRHVPRQRAATALLQEQLPQSLCCVLGAQLPVLVRQRRRRDDPSQHRQRGHCAARRAPQPLLVIWVLRAPKRRPHPGRCCLAATAAPPAHARGCRGGCNQWRRRGGLRRSGRRRGRGGSRGDLARSGKHHHRRRCGQRGLRSRRGAAYCGGWSASTVGARHRGSLAAAQAQTLQRWQPRAHIHRRPSPANAALRRRRRRRQQRRCPCPGCHGHIRNPLVMAAPLRLSG